MTRTIEGVRNALGLRMANALEGTVNKFQQWMVVNRELIDQKFDKFPENLPTILEVGGRLLEGLWNAIKKVAQLSSGSATKLAQQGRSCWACLCCSRP